MIPLGKLFVAIDDTASADAIIEAVDQLERLGTNQARAGRAAVSKIVMSRLNEVDDRVFRFALDQIGSDVNMLGLEPERVGRALSERAPATFGEALQTDGPLGTAARAAVRGLDARELVSVLTVTPSAVAVAVSFRTDILAMSETWSLPGIDVGALLDLSQISPDQAVDVVKAMTVAGRTDTAAMVTSRFGTDVVIRAIEALGSRYQSSWSLGAGPGVPSC